MAPRRGSAAANAAACLDTLEQDVPPGQPSPPTLQAACQTIGAAFSTSEKLPDDYHAENFGNCVAAALGLTDQRRLVLPGGKRQPYRDQYG